MAWSCFHTCGVNSSLSSACGCTREKVSGLNIDRVRRMTSRSLYLIVIHLRPHSREERADILSCRLLLGLLHLLLLLLLSRKKRVGQTPKPIIKLARKTSNDIVPLSVPVGSYVSKCTNSYRCSRRARISSSNGVTTCVEDMRQVLLSASRCLLPRHANDELHCTGLPVSRPRRNLT